MITQKANTTAILPSHKSTNLRSLVPDGGREIPMIFADRVHKEIHRNQQNDSIDRGDPENSFGEFHCVLNACVSRMEFFLGISMVISVNEVGGECGKANCDILRAIRAWGAAKPAAIRVPRFRT